MSEASEIVRENIVPIFSTPHSANQAMLEAMEECAKYGMPKGIVTTLIMCYTNSVVEAIAKDLEDVHN